MSRLVLSLLTLLSAVGAAAQITVFTPVDLEKGEPCDTARYLVYYNMAMVKDTVNAPDKPVKEMMRLEIGGHTSLFYSYDSFLADSANAVVAKNGGNNYTGEGEISWRLYIDYPRQGKVSLLDKFGMDRFVFTEDYAAPLWTPVADSSAVILGYPCSMAVTTYKGRTWYAWYAADVPIDAGPWKLRGLPGLVLRAYDSRKHYVFDAAGLVNAAPGMAIYYKGGKYEVLDRKTYDDLRRRYYADPVGYITNNPRVTVSIKDGKGNAMAAPRNVSYNPLELPSGDEK